MGGKCKSQTSNELRDERTKIPKWRTIEVVEFLIYKYDTIT